jgi:NAD(P)-dependent dehydrogenase (short-subunit alcohol dehydrogenase family)
VNAKQTLVVTGITGTLGAALGRHYVERGWRVVGVSRRDGAPDETCSERIRNAQTSAADARALLACDPDVVILNAGQIETEIGEGGLPLEGQLESITRINYLFPALVCLAAGRSGRPRRLDVVAIGSIADGAPSPFGPVYHASKIALHHFVSATAPIAASRSPGVRLRLLRPGVIAGPLSWAPVNRLNERGRRIRARRCQAAPPAAQVAARVARWIDGDAWIGTLDEPLGFKLLRWGFAVSPRLFQRMQALAWRRASRFTAPGPEDRERAGDEGVRAGLEELGR